MWLLGAFVFSLFLGISVHHCCGELLLIWARSTLLGWKPDPRGHPGNRDPKQELRLLYPRRPLHRVTVLLTGSNRGLGLGLAAHLLALGADLWMGCRDAKSALDSFPQLRVHLQQLGVLPTQPPGGKEDPSTEGWEEKLLDDWIALEDVLNLRGRLSGPGIEEAALGRLRVLPMDLGDLKSVNRALEKVSDADLDVVVLNAGVVPTTFTPTPQGLCTSFQVNFLSHYHFVRELCRRRSAKEAPRFRLVAVGSESHKMASLPGDSEDTLETNEELQRAVDAFQIRTTWTIGKAMPRYAFSKLCLLTWGRDLFRALDPRPARDCDIDVQLRHPGARAGISDVFLYDPGPVHSSIARNAHPLLQKFFLEPILFPLLFKPPLIAAAPMAAWICGLFPKQERATQGDAREEEKGNGEGQGMREALYHMFWTRSRLSQEAEDEGKAKILIKVSDFLLAGESLGAGQRPRG